MAHKIWWLFSQVLKFDVCDVAVVVSEIGLGDSVKLGNGMFEGKGEKKGDE